MMTSRTHQHYIHTSQLSHLRRESHVLPAISRPSYKLSRFGTNSMSDFTKFFNKWPKYLVERPPDAQAPLHYKTSHNHTFSFEQKSYLKLYYVSILPNQAPTVSQMDQDLLDNNRKDEYKAACWELRGKYELRILI